MPAPPKRKPSVLKRARQAEKRSMRNRSVASSVKTAIKKVGEAIESKDSAKIASAMKDAEKKINSARSKDVLHRNTAARSISRLARKAHSALKASEA